MSQEKHTVTKVVGLPNVYQYRGVVFEMDPELRGKKGCYSTVGSEGITATNRKQLIAAIDRFRYQAPTCSCWSCA